MQGAGDLLALNGSFITLLSKIFLKVLLVPKYRKHSVYKSNAMVINYVYAKCHSMFVNGIT